MGEVWLDKKDSFVVGFFFPKKRKRQFADNCKHIPCLQFTFFKRELTTQIARLSQEVYNVHQLLVQEKAARQLAIGYMAKPKGQTKKAGNSVAGGAETGAEDGNTSSPEGGDGASIDGESNGNGSEDGGGGKDGGEDTELLHAKIAELQAQNAAAVKEAKQSKQKAAEAEQQYKRLMEEHSILLSLQKKEKE